MTTSLQSADPAVRTALQDDLFCIADTKLVLGNWFAECVTNGKSLPDFAAMLGMCTASHGQTRAIYRSLGTLDHSFRTLETGRGAAEIRSANLLDTPPRGWPDFIVTTWLGELATWSLAESEPHDVARQFEAMFGLEVMDSIGSSEITYEWIANRPRDGYEVKLVKPGTQDIAGPGEEGEAWVRSRTAAPFYWRKEDATRTTFIDGWTRTGDMLRMSPEGYYQYVSRLNDVFKVSGMWVSPLEVETVISAHPDVHEVAVVGGVDAATGLARPVAFVVLKTGVEGTAQLSADLRERVRTIGGYKVPEIRYIAGLPRTPLMKIDRKTLREELAKNSSTGRAAVQSG